MITESPSLFTWSLSNPRPMGVESFLDRYATDVTFYGSGKAALHDGLAGLVDSGENVLVPAYLPDAVVEPFRDLGLEPRYYRLQENLVPDLADVERRIDDETVAAMSVNYFGFPQPGLAAFSALLEEFDCYHIDDNAHAPFSVDDGTLLGTRGHLGITSLWKVLPIPDGAILYCNDDTVAESFVPSDFAGVRDHVEVADCRFALKSIAYDLINANATVRKSVDGFVAERVASSSDPHTRYESCKTPMSKLSASVVETADPTAIRSARRSNYLAWRRIFDARSDVEVLFESLPDGICPQVFPVRTDTPRRFLDELECATVSGVHTWPRLSSTVYDDPEYEISNALAREVVVLPVHQHVDTSSIELVGDRLRR